MGILWKPRGNKVEVNHFDIQNELASIRNIDNLQEFLNPTSKAVHDPLLLRNMKEAIEMTRKAVANDGKIGITVDVDVDGITSATITYDYLKRKLGANAGLIWHERSDGHGIGYDDIPLDLDLLIVLDSSSNEVERCKELEGYMDIIIIDHHEITDDNPHALIVNPQHKECKYPNKNSCTGLLAFKFIEVLDYHYKKIDTDIYTDLVGLSLLADSMNMSELENRFFVSKTLEGQFNVGLAMMIRQQKLNPKELSAQDLNFKIIPLLNTLTRLDELEKGLSILLEQNKHKAAQKVGYAIKANEERKKKTQRLLKEYRKIRQDEKFSIVVSREASKNFNGLVAGKLAEEYKKPCLVLKDMGDTYGGSFRSYADYPLLDFLKECPHVEFAAGHSGAGGVEIKADKFNEFVEYINEELKDIQFEPEIIYDFEINAEDVDYDFVEEVMAFDKIYGVGSPQLKIRVNNIEVDEREQFPKRTMDHVKIVADNINVMRFYDRDFASDVDTWDEIDGIGILNINEYMNKKTIQLIADDYIKR